MPYVCVWKLGLDWESIIDQIANNPLPYNEEAAAARQLFLDELQRQLDEAKSKEVRFDLDTPMEVQSLALWKRVQAGEFGVTPETAELSWEGLQRVISSKVQ